MFSSGISFLKKKKINLDWLLIMFCFRFKGDSPDPDKQVGLVIPDANYARCQGIFADRDCSISMETGDLTLGSVRIEDEGPYMCRKGFSDYTRYRLRQFNVNGNMFDGFLGHLSPLFERSSFLFCLDIYYAMSC